MPKKIFVGKVIADKMQKTVVVAVESPKRHPFYGKMLKNTMKYSARNIVNAKVGDNVKIVESRHYSKNVSWEVTEVLE